MPRLVRGAFFFAALAVGLASALAGPATSQDGSVVTAPHRHIEIDLDGDLQEWEDVPAVALDSSSHLLTDPASYEGNRDLAGAIQLLWDTTYLFVAGRFSDDRLQAGAAWTSDRVNLVFDFHNDNHPLSYGGQAPDASNWQDDDGWVYAHVVGDGEPPFPVLRLAATYHGPIEGASLVSRVVAGGWTFELRVPWSGLPEARPFVGAVIGLQIFVSDGDGDGSLTELMWSDRWGWSPVAGLSWELWKMGKLVLTGEPLSDLPS